MTGDRVPTPAQASILRDQQSRIRLVEAAPGSGKTWLIAQAMKEEVARREHRPGGVAALSFTNVARDEVGKAFGRIPGHPHTVGTIDSFLFRYVVKPFAGQINDAWPSPKLVPAEIAQHIRSLAGFGDVLLKLPGTRQRESIFDFDFVGETDGQPLITVRGKWGNTPLDARESAEVLREKRRLWEKTGRLSHSDAAYVAAKVVTAFGKRSQKIADLLVLRFPFLIVDELQDTGWYRTELLTTLLAHPRARGLAVGDPDQAIYGFNGANPGLFDHYRSLPGAVVHSLEESIRCPEAVCRVASVLSDSGRKIRPSPAAGRSTEGSATLLVYEGDGRPLVRRFEEEAKRLHPERVVLVTRKNRTVDALLEVLQPAEESFRSPTIELLRGAVQQLRRGNAGPAFNAASAGLARLMFGHELPEAEDLSGIGASEEEWRSLIIACLMDAERGARLVSVYEWGCELRDSLRDRLEALAWWAKAKKKGGLRAPTRSATEDLMWPKGPGDAPSRARFLEVSTVHAIKGETHHTTILFVPETSDSECPAHVWWQEDEVAREEARVAFVAASRPTHHFVLAVHRTTLERLKRERGAFADLFGDEEFL